MAGAAALPAAEDAVPAISVRTMEALDNEYRLTIGDQILYQVIEDRDAVELCFVMETGEVDVPYLGRAPAVGMTCREFAHEVQTRLLAGLYHKATVLVVVNKQRTLGRVIVSGEVARPGPVEIPPGKPFMASEAILAAGGFRPFADEGKVRVIRRKQGGMEGENVELVVDVKAVLERGKLEQDIPLQPEDRVVVRARLINF
jgi:protein involved in polysaccharide export with SLBB domain